MTKLTLFKYEKQLAELRKKTEETMNNKQYWIWLSLAFDSNACAMSDKVLHEFGYNPQNVYNATEEMLRYALPDNERLVRKLANKSLTRANLIITQCEQKNIGILTPGSLYYPKRLSTIAAKPMVLYYKGCIPELDKHLAVSIVGTRKVSPYGTNSAYTIAYDAAKSGAIIVSGMADGIDGIAHRGALDAMGKTIAVLGCGVDVIYPKTNAGLYKELLLNGLIISEYPPETPPTGWHFPQRNRIISGLSNATLVVEAPQRSGSLITAEHAREQGRLLYAVPGKVGEFTSLGTNDLIRTGAKMTTCANDILTDFYSLYDTLKPVGTTAAPIKTTPLHSVARPLAPNPMEYTATSDSRFDNSGDYMSLEVDPRLERAAAASDTKTNENAAPLPFSLVYPDEPLTAEGYRIEPVMRTRKLPKLHKEEESAQSDVSPTAPQEIAANEQATAKTKSIPSKSPKTPNVDLDKLDATDRKIVEYIIAHTKANMDEMTSTGLKIYEIMGAMTLLEIQGIVKALPGGYYTLNEN